MNGRLDVVMKATAEGEMRGSLGNDIEQLVARDFNHGPRPGKFERALTKISSHFVGLPSGNDDEWGFSKRMPDTAVALMTAKLAADNRRPLRQPVRQLPATAGSMTAAGCSSAVVFAPSSHGTRPGGSVCRHQRGLL